jgi:hypothetical protein
MLQTMRLTLLSLCALRPEAACPLARLDQRSLNKTPF